MLSPRPRHPPSRPTLIKTVTILWCLLRLRGTMVLLVLVPLIGSTIVGMVIACITWIGHDDDDDAFLTKEYEYMQPDPSMVGSLVKHSGAVYIVERTIYSQKSTGVKILLARAALPDYTGSICFSICGTPVVIKAIPVPQFAKDKRIYDPMREANAMTLATEIPGVIDLLDCTQNDRYVYIVMPHLTGKDLFNLVEPTSGLPEDDIRRLLRTIVETLSELKETCGIAHHDISLDNMVMDADGALKIIDLGLCVKVPTSNSNDQLEGYVSAMSVPHLYAGKPTYIAPELVRMKSPCNVYAADVWSLGICFYNMLTASALYEEPGDETFLTLERGGIKKLLKKDRIFQARQVSKQAAKLLCCMLHPDPSRRPTFKDILRHPFLTGENPESWSLLSTIKETLANTTRKTVEAQT